MSLRVLRLRQLATIKDRPGLLPVGPATVWRWSRDPNSNFPKPFKLGSGTTVWDADAVEAFINARRSKSAA